MTMLLTGILCFGSSCLLANELQTDAQRQRAEVERILGPLVLTSELSADSLQVLIDEAETQYRLGIKKQAMDGYLGILSVAPRSSMAWLRVGNLHHQSGQDNHAITAYQKAVTFAGNDAEQRATRAKALLNISMLYLEKAGTTLALLEQISLEQASRIAAEVSEKDREDLHRQLQVRQKAQDLDARAQTQVTRMRPSAKRSKVGFESSRP